MQGSSRRPGLLKALDSRAGALILAGLLVGLALLIYRPDRERPFHVLDFSEFIPVLQGADGVLGRLGAVVDYYASQGRFNIVVYLLLAVKWDLFSWWSPGWQIPRAMLMVLLFALTYVLLRRLGTSRLGGLVGCSVYLWSPSATDGWVRLAMAEPIGAAMMLALAIRALQFQVTERWGREVVLMSIGSVALLWTKELMAPLLILPVALALVLQADGSFGFPQRTRRNIALVCAVIISTVLALIPIATLYFGAEDGAYASLYGRGMQSPSVILMIWSSMLIPFELIIAPTNIVWSFAVAGFVMLVFVGWRAALKDPKNRQRSRWLLALALIVPFAGALAYLPNAWYASFYSLPYLIGAALLTGMAATCLQSTRHGVVLVLVAWSGTVAYSATSASNYVARTDAVQFRDEMLVAFVADSVRADSVQFATVAKPAYDWLGFGAAMKRIAAAKGHPWPPTRNASCADARRELTLQTGLLTVNLESTCQFQAPGMKVISRSFTRLDLRRFRFVADSVHADVVMPTFQSRSP